MSASLEKIVRPFTQADVFRPRQSGVAQPAILDEDREPATLDWTGRNDGSYVESSPPGGFGVQAEWLEDRSRRRTSDVRVENPNDSDQYVIVQRIDQMVFKNTKTAEEIDIKPDWT